MWKSTPKMALCVHQISSIQEGFAWLLACQTLFFYFLRFLKKGRELNFNGVKMLNHFPAPWLEQPYSKTFSRWKITVTTMATYLGFISLIIEGGGGRGPNLLHLWTTLLWGGEQCELLFFVNFITDGLVQFGVKVCSKWGRRDPCFFHKMHTRSTWGLCCPLPVEKNAIRSRENS